MRLLENTVMLFEGVPESILKLGDTKLENEVINDIWRDREDQILEERDLNEIKNWIEKEVQEKVYSYFLEFEHPERKDLKGGFSFGFDVLKTEERYQNWRRTHNYLNFTQAFAKISHRAQLIHTGNFVTWPPTIKPGHFVAFIGLSRENEHESSFELPIQRVSYKLNRGEMIVFPSAVSHSYVLKMIAGKTKYIECL